MNFNRCFSRFLVVFSLFFVQKVAINGQIPQLTFPKDTMAVVGDTLDLRIEIGSASPISAVELDLSAWKTLPKMRIVSQSPVDTGGGAFLVQIFCTDTGKIVFPTVTMSGKSANGETWNLPISAIQLQIFPDELSPIKPIMDEEIDWVEDILPIAAVCFAFLAIGLGAFWWWQRRNRQPPPVVVSTIPKKTPSEIALEKLTILEQQQLWQRGKDKEFQTELTFVVREYLENRFGIIALETTTGELMSMLENRQFLDPTQRADLKNVLEIADLSKFADQNPTAQQHQKGLEVVKNIVQI